MVDWRKEIKLSDLVKRKRADGEQPVPEEPTAEVSPVSPAPAPSPAPPPLPEPPPPAAAAPEAPAFELPPAELPVLPPDPDPFVVSPPPVEPAGASLEAERSPEPSLPAPPPLLATPSAPVPPPLPGIHAPVTADELEPTMEAPEQGSAKTPFWKQDVSLRRGEKKYAQLKPKSDGEAKKPFWKQELSLGRKPKAESAEPAAREGKTPFWKKELSLGRGPKEPRQPKQVEAAPPKAAGDKTPFWKRDLSLGRKGKIPVEQRESTPPAPKLGLRDRLSRPRGGSPRVSKRNKRLVGLKIGASQLAAARVVNNGSPEVVQTAREALEPGIVVGGELREPEALAEALRLFFRKHKLPRQDVRLGIANNRIGVRLFEIEGIAEARQLENAVRFRAQEALPIPIEEAVLDYHVLSEGVNDEGVPVRRVLLVVAYRELIDRYVSACKKAGLRLAGIDLEAFALLRALGEPPLASDGVAEAALVVVSVGHERSTFAVSDGRVCEFTRVLEWGGSTLNVALARALDITPSEAEPIKRALSLEHDAVPEGLSEGQSAEAREAVRRQLQTFARELVSSLQFYQNQPGSLGIGEIVITGGTAHLPGLAKELQRLIGVNVRVGDPLARVKLSKRVREPEQVGSLTVAIGLGIED